MPPGRPFLDCLAAAILAGDLPAAGGRAPDPLDLPGITLLLPTRRATRALQEAFLRASGGRAMLLPNITPISEGEEELSLLLGAAGLGTSSTSPDDVPPAIGELERRLTLTSLVIKWSQALRRDEASSGGPLGVYAAAGASTPAQAAQLAAELARLMDMVETEGASLSGLAGLVPETYSEHWQKTLDFLKIMTEFWPVHLDERGFTSPADRRNRTILAEAARLRVAPSKGPVIVAGVTGSIPATKELMQVVASLPNGAIVLPALDTHLDESSWQTIVATGKGQTGHPEHPQFGLKKLLDQLGLTRSDVAVLPGAGISSGAVARQAFLSEAMRPSGSTDRWKDFVASQKTDAGDAARALEGMCLIEAPSAQDEAETVALILREAAETPGKTAALVSPDRLLARRVAVRLESWGIRVDDSAGRPFAKTVPGAFLDLVIEAVAKDLAPPALMSLLKHPLTRLGLDPFAVRRAARALEIAAFRTAYLGDGLDGVDAALERAARETSTRARRDHAVRRLWPEDWDGARDLVRRLREAFAPLVLVYASHEPRGLRAFARAHLTAAEALASIPSTTADAEAPASPLWHGEAGQAALRFFAELLNGALPDLSITRGDYADLYRGLIAGENVRPRVPVHPRLFIWGPFEARLQQTDTVILGSLNDGTWPQSADPGPWLNRPMRQALGLPSPEEKIGYAAHDFISLLGAPQVIMTRAQKIDGVPAVPSRWLLRLQALLDGMGQRHALNPKTPWLGWARSRDTFVKRPPLEIPAPCPAVTMRPRKLSVSRVEAWIANPYSIFANEILKLEPLSPLGKTPDASLRGSIIHEALSRFAKAFPDQLPADPKHELVRLARGVLEDYAAHPRVAAFWVPRFERFAEWFAATEAGRRDGVDKVIAETSGSLVFAAPGGPFTLTARADRIDAAPGGLVITDYKTGKPPADAKVKDGAAPQLPLEAAIALGLEDKAGFTDVAKLPVMALRYISASGGEPPGDAHDVKAGDIATLAAECLEGLKLLVAEFDRATTPYTPVRRARFSYDYDDYAHLARVAEWSAAANDGEEG